MPRRLPEAIEEYFSKVIDPQSLALNTSQLLLDHRQLVIFAKGFLHHPHDLTQRNISMDTVHDVGHRIFGAQAFD